MADHVYYRCLSNSNGGPKSSLGHLTELRNILNKGRLQNYDPNGEHFVTDTAWNWWINGSNMKVYTQYTSTGKDAKQLFRHTFCKQPKVMVSLHPTHVEETFDEVFYNTHLTPNGNDKTFIMKVYGDNRKNIRPDDNSIPGWENYRRGIPMSGVHFTGPQGSADTVKEVLLVSNELTLDKIRFVEGVPDMHKGKTISDILATIGGDIRVAKQKLMSDIFAYHAAYTDKGRSKAPKIFKALHDAALKTSEANLGPEIESALSRLFGICSRFLTEIQFQNLMGKFVDIFLSNRSDGMLKHPLCSFLLKSNKQAEAKIKFLFLHNMDVMPLRPDLDKIARQRYEINPGDYHNIQSLLNAINSRAMPLC